MLLAPCTTLTRPPHRLRAVEAKEAGMLVLKRRINQSLVLDTKDDPTINRT